MAQQAFYDCVMGYDDGLFFASLSYPVQYLYGTSLCVFQALAPRHQDLVGLPEPQVKKLRIEALYFFNVQAFPLAVVYLHQAIVDEGIISAPFCQGLGCLSGPQKRAAPYGGFSYLCGNV